jgi:hypothetical protein
MRILAGIAGSGLTATSRSEDLAMSVDKSSTNRSLFFSRNPTTLYTTSPEQVEEEEGESRAGDGGGSVGGRVSPSKLTGIVYDCKALAARSPLGALEFGVRRMLLVNLPRDTRQDDERK